MNKIEKIYLNNEVLGKYKVFKEIIKILNDKFKGYDSISIKYNKLDKGSYDNFKFSIIINNIPIPNSYPFEVILKDEFTNFDINNILNLLSKWCNDMQIHHILKKDELLSYLFDNNIDFKLVGGAVYDICSDDNKEIPKDYDFTIISSEFLKLCNFVDTSCTADTFIFNLNNKEYTIQLLKTNVEEFDFTISQCSITRENFSIEYNNLYSKLTTDIYNNISYMNRILIPVSYSQKNVLLAMARIPHWKKKGMKITDRTYLSLLKSLSGSNEIEIES